MQKLKNLWNKNKVLVILAVILIICLIAIISVTVSFFLGGNSSVYGDRLEDIDKYPITDSFKSEYIDFLESNEKVDSASIKTSGRIIYVSIKYVVDTTLVDAESLAQSSLEKFSEEILGYYDIDFTLSSDDSDNSEGFTIFGAKNVSGTGLVWNNNTPVESEE